MDRYRTISLIDPDTRRRAAYTATFSGDRFHVEPFDSVAEFLRHANAQTFVLVFDEGQTLDELMSGMSDNGCWAPVIGYGQNLNELRCSQVILMGLIGYLPSPFTPTDLHALLDFQKEHLTRIIDARFQAAEVRQRLKTLTVRETQVLNELQLGLTNREISERLVISPRTVEIHRANMVRKMDARSSAEAVGLSMQARVAL